MDLNISDGGSVRNRSSIANSEGLGFPDKEIDDDNARLVYINDPVKTNIRREFSGNLVSTAKYSIITFIPRNLFEQFHRVAYIYFLLIAILNQLPQLAVFGQGISLLPLTFVVLVSAIKDGYEDYRRHRSDKLENSRLASVLVNGSFQPKQWRHIQVGEIIKIHSNETFPCDIVLLSTSDSKGIAYVQTVNLDGESNLKTRYAKHLTLLKDLEKENINGVIRCEKPNRNIYRFLANMEIDDGNKISLGPSNIILRGCELKNTNWVIGVAIYAGRETKAMLNSSNPPSKRSRLETKMNQEIIFLSFFLVAICGIVSALVGVWLVRHKDILNDLQFYRKKSYDESVKGEDYHYYGWGVQILFTFLMCIIMFQGMIPIALYISMELVRVGQAYFMIKDTNMSVDASKPSFQCRALNINEDLGQIGYVFSDKTGTLTENKMVFQCASIRGVDFSHENVVEVSGQESCTAQVDGRVWRPKMRLNLDPELLRLAKVGKGSNEGKHIHDFFLALATCNTIVPIVVDSDDPEVRIIDYQGESPDEQALVFAASSYGFILTERTSDHIVVDVRGERQRFDVLGIHEFDSDRKRMSVILGCPDKTVKLFVKGADSSILHITDKSMNSDSELISKTESHLHRYSLSGLRTLVVGMKVLNQMEFLQWHSSYQAASNALIDRAIKLQQVADEIESRITLLGATAIEDKLQNGVPEAIESLRKAGIKVWVLTGDKQETAISIGYSSKLLTGEMTQIVINGDSRDSCGVYLQEALSSVKRNVVDSHSGESALIIDGSSLVHLLESEFESLLFELASHCAVVLCCRTAPLQKAGVVALIKNRTDELTLAIGDGANDVSMIQVADVGVGISGQEGRQAVMASDFAIEKFRFLVPLLLVHGHWNYQRISCMILYNFYKNAVYALVTFWYTLFTAYTLTTAITDVSSMLYTVIYTALPTIVVSTMDKDLSRATLLKYPKLYGPGQRDELYNSTLFWLTMLDTTWQSILVFFLPLLAYWQSDIDISSLGDIWTLTIVITVNLHLAMDVMRWNWIIHLAIWGSLVAAVICVVIIDAIPVLPGYWAIFNLAFTDYKGTGMFWLCLIGVPLMSLVPRFVAKVFSQYSRPSDVQIAREAEKLGVLRDWENVEIEMNRFSHHRD